jgi:hypothetical protein
MLHIELSGGDELRLDGRWCHGEQFVELCACDVYELISCVIGIIHVIYMFDSSECGYQKVGIVGFQTWGCNIWLGPSVCEIYGKRIV